MMQGNSVEFWTTTVAIVTSSNGSENSDVFYRHCAAAFDNERWNHCAVEKLLRNPHTGGVGHLENGAHPTTQVQVFQQRRFAEVVEALTSSCVARVVDGEWLGLWVTCKRGEHRSDTIGREVMEELNELTWPDGTTRVFNAMLFPMSEAYGQDGCKSMITQVGNWTENPWTTSPGGVPLALHERYAYNACRRHVDAFAARQSLHVHVVTALAEEVSALADQLEEDERRRSSPAIRELLHPNKRKPRWLPHRGKAIPAFSPLMASYAKPMGAPPQDEPPTVVSVQVSVQPTSAKGRVIVPTSASSRSQQSSKGASSSASPSKGKTIESKAKPTRREPHPPAFPPPSWKRAKVEHISDDEGDESLQQPSETASEIPDWANFDAGPESNWQLLDEFEVDEAARKALFHLGQLSAEGKREAMMLIGKLQNDKHQMRIRNPSVFVHKCACNAIMKINEMANLAADPRVSKRVRNEQW